MISAHEFGTRRGRADASPAEHLAEVQELDIDYVELDVRRTVDDHYVVRHDGQVDVRGVSRPVAEVTFDELQTAAPDTLTFEEALAAIRGHTKAHLDFKFASPPSVYDGPPEHTWEVTAAERAISVIGPDDVVVTTGEDLGVGAVRRWSRATYPDLMVGLSLGGSHRQLSWRGRSEARWSELFPARRFARCGANVVVANRWLATFGVARWSARQGLPLIVWTVDDRRGLRRWLSDSRCWMVTTNNVRSAVRIRAGYLD